MQAVSKRMGPINDDNCWKILLQRDYEITGNTDAPEYDAYKRSFSKISAQKSTKDAYKHWTIFEHETCGGIKARHMMQAIGLWSRCENVLIRKELRNIVESLEPPPSRSFFERAARNLPSSLLAFYAIHAGQSSLNPRSSDGDFFAGLFGSYSCYNDFYSMRLLHINEEYLSSTSNSTFIIGINLGNPRISLVIDYSENPNGSMYFRLGNHRHLVCSSGILSYFQAYIEKLEIGVYEPSTIHPEAPISRGICLFPEAGESVSIAVTNGLEVRASARWFPERWHGPMSFGYSIRIRLVETDPNNSDGVSSYPIQYQLVARNWIFEYEDGTVNRVSGEGAVGRNPLFFRRADKTSGFIDLGPAGSGQTLLNTIFQYQSQSGPVPGTSSDDVTKVMNTRVRGTFSFVPGSISAPTGELFLVNVGEFPLRVQLPFF